MGPKLYTQDELEQVFRQRLRDQEDLIGKVAERAAQKIAIQIRPEFDHVNRRLDDLTEQVTKTNGTVGHHSELMKDMGIEDLSKEQRGAVSEMAVDHEQTKEERKALDRRERRRAARLQLLMTFIGTGTGAVVATVAVVGILRAMGVIH